VLCRRHLYGGSDFRISREYHAHDEPHVDPDGEVSRAFSLNFVEGGQFGVSCARGQDLFSQGAVFVTTPGMEFSITHDDEFPCDTCLSIEFTESGTQWIGDTEVEASILAPNYRAMWLRRLLLDAVENKDRIAIDVAVVNALSFAFTTELNQGRIDATLGASYVDEMMWVRRKLNEEPSEDHSLGRLAAGVGLSAFHLCRLYKLVTGRTIHQALISARLRIAAEMLLDGKNVTDACFAAGFNHLSHFTRTFQRAFAIQPSEFRRKFRGRNRAAIELAAPTHTQT
jgi:AraC family transcriptional regulator